MRSTDFNTLHRRVKLLLALFIIALLLAALTALFLIPAVSILEGFLGEGTLLGRSLPSVTQWIALVQKALAETKEQYPFMFYGTDWVGFAHLVMVIACLGPLRDPVRNIWVLQFGMIGCSLMIPMTLLTGVARHLPWFWQLFDCVIGGTGAVLFLMCYRYARQMEILSRTANSTSTNRKE
ncbi:MAG: hypothetical protein ACYTBJ_09555 [Planctomycetota bacterium]|jgi:hypothetical protein